MPSRSVEVDPFTRLPGQLARGQVEAIRSAVPDALAETVREGGGRFGIRNIRVRLARANLLREQSSDTGWRDSNPGAVCTSSTPFEHDGTALVRHRRAKRAEPT